ncbi:MAG: SMC family ATPase, partial [Firmicutes bacterium]|nr:SMC family ATPase [Bacillota bacterium]
MKPTYLRLNNFLSYRDAEIDLSGINLAALVGENGAGKSSILDAILFALFGESTKGGPKALDQHVTRGESDCRVEFGFELNGSRYAVVRSRSIARNKSSLEFFAMDGTQPRPLSGRTIADTQRIVEQTLRMDYRTFTAASMILQGQADEFTANMTDQERKEVLARILGLDLWDRLQERVRERLKALAADEAALGREEAILRERAGRRAALEAERHQVAAELGQVEASIRSMEEQVAEAERLLGQEPALRQRQRDLEAAVQKARRDREQAERDLRAADEAIRASQAILGRRDEILAAVEDERSLAAGVAEMDRQAEEYMRLSRQVEDLGRKVAEFDRQLEAHVARLKAQLEGRRRQAALLSGVPCAGSQMAAACPLLGD